MTLACETSYFTAVAPQLPFIPSGTGTFPVSAREDPLAQRGLSLCEGKTSRTAFLRGAEQILPCPSDTMQIHCVPSEYFSSAGFFANSEKFREIASRGSHRHAEVGAKKQIQQRARDRHHIAFLLFVGTGGALTFVGILSLFLATSLFRGCVATSSENLLVLNDQRIAG